MIEELVGLQKMSILQCQELAKEVGFDSATFDLCIPKCKIPCKWLDVYLGKFATQSNLENFLIVNQIHFSDDVWCENLMPGKKVLEV